MMVRALRLAVPLAAALLCAACAHTPPTRFYTLVPPPGVSASPGSSPAPYLIDVAPVSVPPQVDVVQLVLRQTSGELSVVDGRQWSAPLPEEIRTSISQSLVHTLGTSDLRGLGAPKGATVVKVRIDVKRFESVLGNQSRIEADWALSRGSGTDGGVLLRCSTSASAPAADKSFESLVQAHQAALAELSLAIAGAIGAAGAGGSPACPP